MGFFHLKRHFSYSAFIVFGILLFYSPLHQLFLLSLKSELYSHFLLIPFVSLYFLIVERKSIFLKVRWQPSVGLYLAIAAIGIYAFALHLQASMDLNDFLSACLAAFVLWLNAGFLMVYGFIAFKSALFPLMFLVFIIPIPSIILDPIIRFLQVFSAHAVHLVFYIFNIPFLREDMTFKLPGIAIEIAKECSGIRSSMALLISSILAGQIFLCSTWRKITLIFFVLPVTIIKNAFRITTLSLLAIHIDKSWLIDSWLHKSGGIVFFLLALLFLTPVLWLLLRSEQKDALCTNRLEILSKHLSEFKSK